MTRPSTGAGRPNTGRGVTFHFQLSEAHSAERGASHQKYIERESACAASFGTVGDTIEERCDAWREIDSRSIARTGWVECEEWASTKEKETFRHATGERKRFSTKDYDEYAEVMSQVRDANAGRMPEHVRTHAPRRSIVQRRLIAELAHELPIERQKIALERWCTKNLGRRGVQWHAVIHAPEGKNDPRNWHAHIVFTTVNLDRMRNDGKLPQQGQFVRILNGNGKRKKKGAAELVRRMRSSWAEEQNRELENEGCEKRYDPRSYRAAGIDREPGEHLGPARAALERTEDGALYWSQDRIRRGPDTDEPEPATNDEDENRSREEELAARREQELARTIGEAITRGADLEVRKQVRTRQAREAIVRWKDEGEPVAEEIERWERQERRRERNASQRTRQALEKAMGGDRTLAKAALKNPRIAQRLGSKGLRALEEAAGGPQQSSGPSRREQPSPSR